MSIQVVQGWLYVRRVQEGEKLVVFQRGMRLLLDHMAMMAAAGDILVMIEVEGLSKACKGE